jgi:tRNA1(Val) A37 N6-methylase TrmN6
MSTATTLDRLLDGSVQLRQPADGYRAGLDAVLLAAALDGRPDEHVVEFGCGPGAALICAATRLPDSRFTGVEIDPGAARLARENTALNDLSGRLTILEGDIADVMPEGPVDQVFFNPPFFDDPSSIRPPSPQKHRARLSGETPLPIWVKRAAQLLNGKGRLTLIHRAEALTDILGALEPSYGSVVIKPIQPHSERPAKRVLVTAKIGGRTPLVILPPLVLHDAGAHRHTVEVDAVLRGKASISLAARGRAMPA